MQGTSLVDNDARNERGKVVSGLQFEERRCRLQCEDPDMAILHGLQPASRLWHQRTRSSSLHHPVRTHDAQDAQQAKKQADRCQTRRSLITTNDAEVEAVGSTGRSLFQWTLFPTLVTVVGSFVGLVMPSYRPGSVWSFSVAILACSSLLWLIAVRTGPLYECPISLSSAALQAALFQAYLDFEASIRNFNTCGTFIEAPSCHIVGTVDRQSGSQLPVYVL